jgi:hypothetical protein
VWERVVFIRLIRHKKGYVEKNGQFAYVRKFGKTLFSRVPVDHLIKP